MRLETLAAIGGAAIGGALIGAAVLAGPAEAEDWTVTVGARIQGAPPYEGADHDLILPLPTLSLRRAGRPERPSTPDDGYGVAVISERWISLGPALRLRGSRNDKGLREGLRKVDLAAETGLFVTLWPTDWLRLRAEERRGVFGHHGWTGDAGFDLAARSGRWMGSLGPRIGWGDRSYMDTYFGVTPAEAAASPVVDTAYAPRGGVRYAGVAASLAYRFKPRWQAAFNAGYHRLAGIAADSPIVRMTGARNEYSGGIGVKYSFGWTR